MISIWTYTMYYLRDWQIWRISVNQHDRLLNCALLFAELVRFNDHQNNHVSEIRKEESSSRPDLFKTMQMETPWKGTFDEWSKLGKRFLITVRAYVSRYIFQAFYEPNIVNRTLRNCSRIPTDATQVAIGVGWARISRRNCYVINSNTIVPAEALH